MIKRCGETLCKTSKKLSKASGQRLGEESEPEEFASNLRFRPFWMLAAYACAIEFGSELTHLEGQKEPLLSGHRAMNVELQGLRGGACVRDRHRKMVPRSGVPEPLLAGVRVLAESRLLGQRLWERVTQPPHELLHERRLMSCKALILNRIDRGEATTKKKVKRNLDRYIVL